MIITVSGLRFTVRRQEGRQVVELGLEWWGGPVLLTVYGRFADMASSHPIPHSHTRALRL